MIREIILGLILIAVTVTICWQEFRYRNRQSYIKGFADGADHQAQYVPFPLGAGGVGNDIIEDIATRRYEEIRRGVDQ